MSDPIGNRIDLGIEDRPGEKQQLGVSGTSMPGRPKSPLNLLFVLDRHVATLPKDLKGVLRKKIRDRVGGSPRIKAKRGGPSSTAPFEEQAIIVRLTEGELPIQDAQLHWIAETIERHYEAQGFPVSVKTVAMDTE